MTQEYFIKEERSMIGKTASLDRARKFIQDTSKYIKFSQDAILEYEKNLKNKQKPIHEVARPLA